MSRTSFISPQNKLLYIRWTNEFGRWCSHMDIWMWILFACVLCEKMILICRLFFHLTVGRQVRLIAIVIRVLCHFKPVFLSLLWSLRWNCNDIA